MGTTTIKTLKYNMSNKIVLITGVHGLGFEIGRMLAGSGAHVILTSSTIEKAESIQMEIRKQFPDASTEAMKLNLEDFNSIRTFVEEYTARYEYLDVLINHAAVYQTKYKKSSLGLEKSFTINHLGVFLLTTLLLPVLEKSPISPNFRDQSLNGPRIVMITSHLYTLCGPLKIEQLSHIDEQSFKEVGDQVIVYARTKLCNLLFAEELNTRIKEVGSKIVVNSVQINWDPTEIDRNPGFGSSIERVVPQYPSVDGALCVLFVCCDPSLNSKGGKCYIEPFKEVVLRDFACNQKTAKDLWEYSERVVEHSVKKWF